MTFTFNTTKEMIEKVANEFVDIKCVADNDICKAWTMVNCAVTCGDTHITKYHDGVYRFSCNDGKYLCYFDGNKITITEGEYMGRKRKADKMLKVFTQSAMRVWCLVNAGKID